jgi:hypothetical protein
MALGTTHLTRTRDEVREEGWLREGVIAGFVATFAMTVVLAAAYGLARAIGDEDGATIERWVWNLAHNPVTERPEDYPFIAIGLNLLIGLALGAIYARIGEPLLGGPGWRKGITFSLIPWIISIVAFLPIMGGGFLGMDVEAGPLPILGNLILHVVYGAILGGLYGLRLNAGLDDTPAEIEEARRSERGAALGVVAGVALGAFAGWLLSGQIEEISTTSTTTVVGALAGGAIGLLIGSIVGMGEGLFSPDHPGYEEQDSPQTPQ